MDFRIEIIQWPYAPWGEKGTVIAKAFKKAKDVLHRMVAQMPSLTLKKDDGSVPGQCLCSPTENPQLVPFNVHLQERYPTCPLKLMVNRIHTALVAVAGSRRQDSLLERGPGRITAAGNVERLDSG